jgi:hypothetical protein
MANWLDKYEQGGLVLKKKTKDNYGKKANPNDVQASVGPDFVGLGYNIKGRDYSPAWGGRFAMGGSMPGAVGFTYARVAGSAPANGKYTKKTKASAQNGQEMKFYQEGLDFKPKSISQDGKTIPNEKEEIKPITTSQRNIGQAAAWKVIEAIKANTPYQLSESAVKSGIDQSLTCIGGVCNVYKDLGVDFSGVGNEKQGVRESRTKGKVVEYNPTFDKNYKAAGFEKVKGRPIEFNELTDIIQKGNLNPGDFIQYYNEKGIPDHTNIVLGSNPDGSVEVYNSYKHGQATRGESKEPYVYTLNPEAQDYKGKKINVFRVGDQKATEIRDASANDPSGITNTWFNYNMEKAIQRRMKILEKDYQELAKQSGEPAKKLTPSQLRKAAIEEERRIYESDPMFKRNLERINTVDFSESPQEAMYRTLNKKKNGGWLDNYSEPIRDDRGQWAYPGEVTEIGSNEITMQGVDYPVLGVSDTGDTQMMYPDQDYKFDGEKVTEYPMAQNGDWLKKYATEPMRQDATRNVIPRKMTDRERLEAVATSDQAQKKALNTAKEVIAERKKNIATKGDLNTPGSWYTEDKARLFPSSVGGAGEIFDEYINPATYVGVLADALGESVAARDPKAIATSLALAAGTGALGIDPLGSALKVPGKVTQSMESGLLSNAWRLNPKAYQYNIPKDAMFRGIGKEGMEDAVQSGLFRAKQNVTPTSIGNFNTTRQFSKAYYTPRFDIADQYGQGFIAEVPRAASDWGKRYGKKEWSQIAQRDVPITEGKILKKDWLKGYKEVPKPTASEQVVRGPIPAPYKGTTLPYDNVGYKEPATGELAPYMTPEFEAIPYSELPKTVYHGGPSVISDAGAIRTTREGLPIQSATSPTSRGFYATPNTWMHMEGSPNPLRDVEGFYPKLASENAENYAMGRGDAYIHRGEFVENPRIVDWKTFSQMEPVKNLNPDFRRLSPEAAKIAEDLGIYGLRDNSEYNILNPQKVFKSFKPAYKNLGKGWEKYNKGGWLNKYK